MGLISLAGLIYQADPAPAQAASRLPTHPTKPGSILLPLSIQAQAQITAQNTITPLDVVVVFDVSGSMENQTNCDDCWVRTSYDPNYPNNGYFNPLPYNPAWATAGTGTQAIPQSDLCTVYPPQPFITGSYKYLTVEAELYSRNVGSWNLNLRTGGRGFWALQRGSKLAGNNILGEDNEQRNAAGDPSQQSSNVCRPSAGGIDCTVGAANDDICSSGDDGLAVDCSAYIAARPFTTYTDVPGNIPRLSGAAYNADCFSYNTLSSLCWLSSPFTQTIGFGPSDYNIPWVEYDFTPTWNGNTYIWIRAIGGGDLSFTWAGDSPDDIQPDPNGGGTGNNLAPWRKVIYWQVNNGAITQRKDNLNSNYLTSPTEDNNSNRTTHFQKATTWRDNRADNDQWRWIKLGSTMVVSGTQSTLKIYQGSAGYKIDKPLAWPMILNLAMGLLTPFG